MVKKRHVFGSSRQIQVGRRQQGGFGLARSGAGVIDALAGMLGLAGGGFILAGWSRSRLRPAKQRSTACTVPPSPVLQGIPTAAKAASSWVPCLALQHGGQFSWP